VGAGLAGLALAISLLGCEKKHGDPTACSVEAPSKPTRVNVISYESPGMPFFGDQMAQCSHVRNLTVRHQTLPYDELVSQSTISMSSRSSSPYHIIHAYDQLVVEWAGKGWLAPLDDLVQKYWDKYDLGAISPGVWESMKVNGHIYSIPAIQNPEILFFRKDILADAGIEPPRTFAEMAKACQVLRGKGGSKYPLVMMYSKMSDHFIYEFAGLLHSLGGRWFTDDARPAFNDATGVAALDMMVGLYRGCLDPGVVNLTPEDALIGLQQGQFVMGVMWMNFASQMDDPAASKFPHRFGFALPPAACSTCPPAGYWAEDSWVIPANASVNRDLLFRIAMEGTDSANQAKAADITLVTRMNVSKANESPYWAPGVATIAAGAVALERRPYAYLAKYAVERYGLEALLGTLSAKEALDRAALEYSRSLEESGYR
jgi:ABC-type glycerol-3-phosphate transport system substrate-binding protein